MSSTGWRRLTFVQSPISDLLSAFWRLAPFSQIQSSTGIDCRETVRKYGKGTAGFGAEDLTFINRKAGHRAYDSLRNMQFDYSVASMLPFARTAIRGTSNFDLKQFSECLFSELEKANVPGVVRESPQGVYKYNFSDLHCPNKLKYGVIEVFCHLLHRGFIAPEAQTFPVALNYSRYWKTARGESWAAGGDPVPEDVAGYMHHLTSLVPSIDPVIRQYVQEGLGSFAREMYFSAAVMLGAASEKEIYLLGGSLAGALKDTGARTQFTNQLNGRSLYSLLMSMGKHLAMCKVPRAIFDGAQNHLTSLFESIRVQRNDAVHPNTANVFPETVRLSYDAFPPALQKAESLRKWFDENPLSI